MTSEGMITLVAFLMASSGVLLVFTLVSGRNSRLDARLDGLAGRGDSHPEPDAMAAFARTALPRMGTALVPTDEEERTLLKTRLIHAGLYGRQAMPIFLGVKLLLMVAPALVGLAAGLVGLTTVQIRRDRRSVPGRPGDDRPELLARQHEGQAADRASAVRCPTPSTSWSSAWKGA